MNTYTYKEIPIYEDHNKFYVMIDLGNIIKRVEFDNLDKVKQWIDSVLTNDEDYSQP